MMSFDRKFVLFNIPQIQYKNPWVQIMMFKNMTPSPFLRFYLGKMKILIRLSWCWQLCGHILMIFNMFSRWWWTSADGCRRKGLQRNHTACEKDSGQVRVSHSEMCKWYDMNHFFIGQFQRYGCDSCSQNLKLKSILLPMYWVCFEYI